MDGDRVWLATRAVDGQALTATRLPDDQAFAVAAAVADALDFAHSRRQLHSDLGPNQILHTASDTPVVLNVGLLGLVRRTAANPLTGGPLFAAPEVIGGHPLGPATDQYSLACLLYTLLTGAPPFATGTPQQIASASAAAEPSPPSTSGRVCTAAWGSTRAIPAAMAAAVCGADRQMDLREAPGSGASGGLGAGLAAGLGAQLLPRFEVMFDHVDLAGAIAGADLVFTGEGSIDFQTPRGKIPAEVARIAARYEVPVVALAGTIGAGAQLNYAAGIDAMSAILPAPLPLDEALARAAEYLADAAERTMRLLLVGRALA